MSSSLVVPLFNEEDSIGQLLESIEIQDRPPSEILLIDAGSTDGTVKRVEAYKTRLHLQLISCGRLHPGEARNEGVRIASHEWIAFTDAGIRLEPTWLLRLMERAVDGVDVVWGSYTPICDSLWVQASAIAYTSVRSNSEGRGPCVASMAIRRQAFLRLKGFPEYRAAEDLAFIEHIVASGLRVVFAPDAIVHWRLAATPAATFRRFALYSHHNLAAGRGRSWHAGVARMYALFGLVAMLAFSQSVALGLAAVPAFFLARAVRAAHLHRSDLPIPTMTFRRVLCTAVVLLVIDIATFVGVFRWLRQPLLQRSDRR